MPWRAGPIFLSFRPSRSRPKTRRCGASWRRNGAEASAPGLPRRGPELDESMRAPIDSILDRRQEIMERVGTLLPAKIHACKIRQHGDFHLGQVLFAKDDACILDFEGEP